MAGFEDAADHPPRVGSKDLTFSRREDRRKLRWITVRRRGSPDGLTFDLLDRSVVRTSELCRTFDNGLQDDVEIERRSADRLQDVCSCRLLLERLFCFPEEPRILDGDRCLIRERLKKIDLLLSEWLHNHSSQRDRPDRGLSADERRDETRPPPVFSSRFSPARILVNCDGNIRHRQRPAFNECPAIHRLAIDWIRERQGYWDRPCMCRDPQLAALREHDHGVLRRTESGGALRDRVEHRLNLHRRRGDDPENLRNRGLTIE